MDITERRRPLELPTVSFVVTVVDGREAGRSVTVDPSRPSRVLVGKSPICDIVLSDPMVSRRHAAFEVTSDNRLVLTDLGSMNGTYANDVAIATAYLEGGEVVRVGGVELRVDVADGRTRTSPNASPTTANTTADPGNAGFGRLVGDSPRMRVLYTLCARLAASDLPIVIEGETGTGKELVAECIHEASARAAGPFIVFDASAIPRSSLEVTLFGQAESPVARAGGDHDDPPGAGGGVFELAHGGTLLMDSIDELDLDLQPRVLRAIDRGEVMRVGDTAWRRVNVRVIAATNRNLDKLVEEEKFREDLFFRLAVTRLEVPPLRRRDGDVPILVRHFFMRQQQQQQQQHVTDDFLARHEGYEWPGNVRELENSVARVAALGDVAHLLPTRRTLRGSTPPPQQADSSGSSPAGAGAGAGAGGRDDSSVAAADFIHRVIREDLTYAEARSRVLDNFSRLYVERVLAQNGGNVSRAAAASGLARRYFQTLRSRQKA